MNFMGVLCFKLFNQYIFMVNIDPIWTIRDFMNTTL